MGNNRKEHEPEGRTAGRSWSDLVGNLGEVVARTPLRTAQLGTSLVRNLAEALDDVVVEFIDGQEPPKEGRHRQR